MDAGKRHLVRKRAGERCEYCRLPEAASDSHFHVEHIVARQHRGDDDDANLPLACNRCNLAKGPNLSGIDDNTATVVPLFHPRRDQWDDHFQLIAAEIVGITPTGRATVHVLQMNEPRRLHLRSLLLAVGRF